MPTAVLDADVASAREKARAYARHYLGRRNYTNNLLRPGFTDQEVSDGGSDRLIDAVIPHGNAEEIATVIREHLDAGANHIALQSFGELGSPRRGWASLAEILTA